MTHQESNALPLLPTARQGAGATSRLMWIVLINGLILSIGAMVLLQYYMAQTINSNQDNQRSKITKIVTAQVKNFETRLEPLDYLFTAQYDVRAIQDYIAHQRSKNAFPSISYLMWWPAQEDSSQPPRIIMGDYTAGMDFLGRVRPYLASQNAMPKGDKSTLLSVASMVARTVNTSVFNQNHWFRYKSDPLIWIKETAPYQGRAGYLAAVFSAEKLLNLDDLATNDYVRRLTIKQRDNASIFEFFPVPISTAPDPVPLVAPHPLVFEHNVAGKIGAWRLEVEFFSDQQSDVLGIIPWLVLLAGLMVTGFATFYVRNNQRQSYVLTKVNRTLALKNMEMNAQVTERERLNQILRKTERDSRTIMNAVRDVIFEVDQNSILQFLNERWQAISGHTAAQSIGSSLFDYIHADEQARLQKDFERFLLEQIEDFRVATQIRCADETWRMVDLSFTMVRREENAGLHVVGTMSDVDAHLKAQAALQKTEAKYQDFWEHTAVGLYQMAPDGRLLAANPTLVRMFDYKSDEEMTNQITNMNNQMFVAASVRQEAILNLADYPSGASQQREARAKNGRIFWVDEQIRAVHDASGQVEYYEGSLTDITEQRSAEMALKEAMRLSDLANRSKTEFLANMSHELRTPLNSIIGFSEIIKDQVLGEIGNTQYLDYARDINDSGKNLLTIINTILDVARIEAGERQLDENLLDVSKLIDKVIFLMQNKIEASGHNVQVDIGKGLPKLLAEELAIKQILSNLLSNAIKFTPDAGLIRIQAVRETNGEFRLSVSDTGMGLNADELARIKTPFGQASGQFARSSSGPGLGLTLVHSLVRLHSGTFDLVSQKGIGTTASVILPASRMVVG